MGDIRTHADALDTFADRLTDLMKDFDRAVTDSAIIERFSAIKGAEHIDGIAIEARKLADQLNREADAAEDAEFERQANPLEPDFRRIS